MQKIIIAIDGYSACGKSSTAKLVAAALGYSYIDTGAMYRAVTLYFYENYIELTNPKAISNALDNIDISFRFNPLRQQSDTFLNNQNVEDEIRKMYISERVSPVSAIADVRKAMVRQQQKMGRKKGIVMDGRDIGTTVFPEAEVKVFMTADLHTRAIRRQKELIEKDEIIDLDEILENLKTRDQIDTSRPESPLRMATDAYFLDTTFMAMDEQVDYVLQLATTSILKANRKKEVMELSGNE
ncbi:MAG: (d)CMP kinase [Thermonemataceae bacterium]|nr:(d)CMP kinase [Thermonemataceae bacterium]